VGRRLTGIKNGCHCGDVLHNGLHVATLELSIPGIHNLFNATMAVAACAPPGRPAQAAEAVSKFTGVDRG